MDDIIVFYRRLLYKPFPELRRPKSTASSGNRRRPRRMDSDGSRIPRAPNRCLLKMKLGYSSSNSLLFSADRFSIDSFALSDSDFVSVAET